jgi:hypothetical protein
MNIHPKFRVGWLLFTVPFISTLSVSVVPSRAATFSSATTLVNLTNFSTNAESSSVSVDTAALAVSPVESISNADVLDDLSVEESISAETVDGSVAATTDFTTVAFFPPGISGSSFVSSETDNEAFGEGGSYVGKSQTESTVLANFFLNPEAGETQTFSFDFNIFWGLETFTSQVRENSTATADVSLSVCGRTSLAENPLFCDSLSTFGRIESPEAIDTFAFQQSDAFSVGILSNPLVSVDSTLNFKQADFFALGSYQREFNTPIYLTLAEVQYSEAAVSVPEPSATIALLSLSAIAVALGKRKN